MANSKRVCPNPRNNPDCLGKHTGRKPDSTCASCYHLRLHEDAKDQAARCSLCGAILAQNTKGDRCISCLRGSPKETIKAAAQVFEEEARVSPPRPEIHNLVGDWCVVSDNHIPFHDPEHFVHVMRTCAAFGVRKLLVGGDLIMGDEISKYIGVGPQVKIEDELMSTRRVLKALLTWFDRIVIIPGNHDQRVEKWFARMAKTGEGNQGLRMISKLLRPEKGEVASIEELVGDLMAWFLGHEGVELHKLPLVTVNGQWLVIHPGSASRVPPQTERKMAVKHDKSVVAGHNHLWGVGFEDGARHMAINIGHGSAHEKFRYTYEKPSTFPAQVKGYCILFRGPEENTGGFCLPIARHHRYADPHFLARRVAKVLGKEKEIDATMGYEE